MIITLSILGILTIVVIAFINQASFGRTPSGERKQRVENSPNYRDGSFQNVSPTLQFTGKVNMFRLAYDFTFGKNDRLDPKDEIPSIKTDLLNIDRQKDIFVWFGHSSYFIQIDGKRILVDPVLSGAASPVSFLNKAFKGADIYKAEDIPEIDYLVITHDHWDHLDYNSVMKLKERTSKVICSLGVGQHFEHWGFPKDRVIEMDWNEDSALADGFSVHCLPTRHFSGRGLSPKQSLWASYMLQTPSMKIYIGGDGGYDTHFAKIGERFGEVDLAVLENGQYGANWAQIHLTPEESVQASKDLNAKCVIPVHSGKFSLSVHPWDEPLIRFSAEAKKQNINYQTPMIGEPVDLKDGTQVFKEWWVGLD